MVSTGELTDTPVRAGSKHADDTEQVIVAVHTESGPAACSQCLLLTPPHTGHLDHRPNESTLRSIGHNSLPHIRLHRNSKTYISQPIYSSYMLLDLHCFTCATYIHFSSFHVPAQMCSQIHTAHAQLPRHNRHTCTNQNTSNNRTYSGLYVISDLNSQSDAPVCQLYPTSIWHIEACEMLLKLPTNAKDADLFT